MKTIFANKPLISGAVELANKVGWYSSIVDEESRLVEVKANGTTILFDEDNGRKLRKNPDEIGCKNGTKMIVKKLPNPGEMAIAAFRSALPLSPAHATIFAPLGGELAPEMVGGIDTVILENPANHCLADDLGWTIETVTISHTRCWLVSIYGISAQAIESDQLDQAIAKSNLLVQLPKWIEISDTAVLTEYMRDIGWTDARFPHLLVVSSRSSNSMHGSTVLAWLAVTEAAVAVVAADSIGVVAAPQLSNSERFAILNGWWRNELLGAAQ